MEPSPDKQKAEGKGDAARSINDPYQSIAAASDALGLRNETEAYITRLADDPRTDSFVSKFLRL